MGAGVSKTKTTDATATLKTTSMFLASAHNQEGIKTAAAIAKKESTLTTVSRPSVSDNRRRRSVAEPDLIDSTKVDSEGVQHILHGNPKYGYEAKPHIVRIFTSSTFTDTFHERNLLMVEAYPKLKDFCQKSGYEFQVVDMRWGVREDSENDHMAVELCMKELKACQKLSTGPNFVSFLSHKYGYRPFPRVIVAEEFDKLTDQVTEEEENIIEDWFLLDENFVPPVYVLQPISTHFPDFLSEDVGLRNKAKDAWWDVFCTLQNILVRGAKENLSDAKHVHKYVMSVTERELEAGILTASETDQHCVWFKRHFVDIDIVPGCKALSKHTETTAGDSLALDDIKSCFSNLRDHRMPSKLSASRIHTYPIAWDTNKGVNPDNPEHAAYLRRLCADFVTELQCMIQAGIDQAQQGDALDPVISEVVEHSAFRHQLCQLFSGRSAMLKDIERYVCGDSQLPLIVIGGSGSGKTSILAMVITKCWEWLGGRGATVYRFLGSTKLSSSIKPLLKSLNKQLSQVFGIVNISSKYFKAEESKTLVQGFIRLLKKATKEKPLILVLDSLDNLDTADGGRQLEWLPRQLPPNVKVILSMRPEEKYGVFPRCKTIFREEMCYRLVPTMTLQEVEEVIDTFLTSKNRSLIHVQHLALIEGYKRSSSPLYLKLALDESMRWHSYDPPDVTCLYSSVTAMVNAFFKRLEKQHGQTLVSFALAFFTAAQNGLSEAEMEDLLSLNDTVLNDVYQYWVPPVRRLPPLLWVRIKADLEPYLSKRSVSGIQLYIWSYHQFTMTCRQRYLDNQESRILCHTLLAEYLLATWTDKPKPYKDKSSGEVREALRYVARQPLRYDNHQYNLRKLNQLPYHLIHAHMGATLKSEVLCNYEFILAKISAVGISAMLRDFKSAQMVFPADEDIAIILETLQLSQHAIEKHPKELAGQLIGRLYMNLSANQRVLMRAKDMISANELEEDSVAMVTTLVEMLEKLVNYQNIKYANILGLVHQARASSIAVLVPNTACLVKPGGQLLHNISGHLETINTLDVTANGNKLITGSDDNTIKFWEVASGELLASCQVDSDVMYSCLCQKDTKLVTSTVLGTVYIIDVSMATIVMERNNVGGNNHTSLPLTVCHPSKGPPIVVTLTDKHLITLDSKNLNFIGSYDSEFDLGDKVTLIKGGKNEAIFTHHDSHHIWVANLKDAKHVSVNKYEAFRPPEKISSRRCMISAVWVAAEEGRVIVCSGQTQDVYTLCTNTGKVLTRIPGHPKDRIQDVYQSTAENLIYYTRNDEVGTYNLKTGERNMQFPHPCRVLRVISCDLQHVVTLGEDNLLRIWDKAMRAFTPDVSEFSGKVTVHSKASMDTFQSILETFSDQFDQNLNDTKAILTTEDVKNYWTQGLEHALFLEEVTTRFFPMPNRRYLVVTQDGVDPDVPSRAFSQCLTVWDLASLQCVRRFFPPWQMLYVRGVLSNERLLFTDVGQQGSPLYVLDISGDVFQPHMVYNGEAAVRLGGALITIPGGRYVVAESVTCDLCLYDLEETDVKVTVLRTKTATSSSEAPSYTNLKLSGESVLAVHSERYLCCWGIATGGLIWEVDLYQYTIGLQETVPYTLTLHCTPDHKLLLVAVDLPAAEDHGKVAKATAVFDINSGSYLSSLNRLVPKDYQYKLALLRLGSDKLLQLVALTSQGKAFLLDEISLGRHPDCHLVNESGTSCVTWCTEAKEDRLAYWNLEGKLCQNLGGFTLDEQLNCAYLPGEEAGVIVSTATGLVRLNMTGNDVRHSTDQLKELPQLYAQPELNVEMEIGDN